MNAHKILKLARAKIERPECWTQGAYARDADGCGWDSDSRNAVCWCSVGAVLAVGGWGHGAVAALDELVGGDIAEFNDTHTHAEVLEAFDKAIEATKPSV